jgi:hypothetical protein
MRNLVISFNIVSVVAILVILPFTFYVGVWGLLGPAYGRPQDAAFGLLIMAAPILVTILCVYLSLRAMRRGSPSALIISLLPLGVAVFGFAALVSFIN